MYIKGKLTDAALKPCPYCGTSFILVSDVDYPKGMDEGYRVACSCGWASRLLRKWYPNKVKLISDWNSYILEGEELTDP